MSRKIAKSAGLLVFRDNNGIREFLVVHPSGAYNKKSPYYIPKGGIEPGETSQEAAIRETYEETGVTARIIADLGTITYKSKSKKITAFLAQFIAGPPDKHGVLDWPDWENDIKRFVPEEIARVLLRKEMLPFIDRAVACFG